MNKSINKNRLIHNNKTYHKMNRSINKNRLIHNKSLLIDNKCENYQIKTEKNKNQNT